MTNSDSLVPWGLSRFVLSLGKYISWLHIVEALQPPLLFAPFARLVKMRRWTITTELCPPQEMHLINAERALRRTPASKRVPEPQMPWGLAMTGLDPLSVGYYQVYSLLVDKLACVEEGEVLPYTV